MKFLFGNALWHLLMQSDLTTKMIMFFLLVMSVVCWSIIFYKWTQISEKRKQLQKIKHMFATVRSEYDRERVIKEAGVLYGSSLVHHFIVQSRQNKSKDAIDEQCCMHIDEMIYQENSYMIFLFIAASSGPLIGLFGTVWGLMHSFMNIAQKQSADIVTVAPGIAEALLTTLGGLIVAIPALVMYHYLTFSVRVIEHDLYALYDALLIQTPVQK